MDPLDHPGVRLNPDALLKLRHLVRSLPERRLGPTGRPGGFVSRKRGRGLEVVDVREFTEGDDIRHIDRNTTARTGITHVRTFRDEREKTAILLADFRPSMLWGTRRALRSVVAAEALTLVGWRVLEAGGRVGLVAFGGGPPIYLPPRGRERAMARVIGGLVKAHRVAMERARGGTDISTAEDPPLASILEHARAVTPNGGSVFLATSLDRPGANFDGLALSLHRRVAFSLLLVIDAFEHAPPPGRYGFATEENDVRWGQLQRPKSKPARIDPRQAHLQALGLEVVPILGDRGPEAVTEDLDRVHGQRF